MKRPAPRWSHAGLRGDVIVLGMPEGPASQRSLRGILTPDDHRSAQRLTPGSARRRHLLASALLRLALGRISGRPPRRVRFLRRQRRRPLERVTGATRHALSLSHAAGWVFVAVGRGGRTGRRLGLDIEAATRTVRPGLERRLPWREQAGSRPPDIGDWTFVEAALKADGRGLPGLSHLEADGPAGLGALRLRMALPPRHRLLITPLRDLPPALVGALAQARPGPQEPSR